MAPFMFARRKKYSHKNYKDFQFSLIRVKGF